jgi:serine/threonine protein kinase
MSLTLDPLGITGQTIKRYTVLRYCGSGAAGRIYEATAEGQRFAVKVYKEWLFDEHPESQDDRIAREASLHRVVHPNVCKVFEFGRTTIGGVDRRYLVMEFIDGESLDKLIQHHVFQEWRPFADVARSLIDALTALHASGCIHRDIKPANVMVESGTRRVVLSDFGVVADLEATTLLTEGHEFLGTMAYAAPEWLMREPESAGRDPAIDVYSLGATFYEMMTGQRLFVDRRNRHQLAKAIAESVPTVIVPSGYPRPLASLVREMLAKSPGSRPTLDQVSERLSEIVLSSPDPTVSSGESSTDDPYAAFRQIMSQREDVHRAAEQEALKKRRWDEFEEMWEPLERSWKGAIDRLASLPGVVETHTHWRGSRKRTWENVSELLKTFPDRAWDWGRSFDCEVALPGTGVQVVYFFHGLEDFRTGITRFVATLRPRDPEEWPDGLSIQIETAESWMGPLQEVLKSALQDVTTAERLAILLLNHANSN